VLTEIVVVVLIAEVEPVMRKAVDFFHSAASPVILEGDFVHVFWVDCRGAAALFLEPDRLVVRPGRIGHYVLFRV
jgi:hypothetical protein